MTKFISDKVMDALRNERKGIIFYKSLAENVRNIKYKKLFLKIANDEKRHKELLEKAYIHFRDIDSMRM